MRTLLALTLFSCIPLAAQTGAASGSIRGTVLDPSGGAVTGAGVTARNLDTGFERKATSDPAGEYEVPLLLPGRYEVKVEAWWFCFRKPVC